jgi:transposase
MRYVNIMKNILGIDVAKKKFDAALLLNGKYKCKVFENNKKGFLNLKKWLINCKVVNIHACMESTGIYGLALADNLYEQECTVSIVNPVRIKSFGKSKLLRNKTDKIDAKVIAEFCAQMNPPSWIPKQQHIKELDALTKRLDDLSALLQQEKSRLETSPKSITKFIKLMIKYIETQIKIVNNKIKIHIESNPDLKHKSALLATIPGVGEITIAKILTFLDYPGVFKNAKKVAAYLGLTPRNYESGSSVRGKARLSKIGDSRLRKALYFPTIAATNYNPIIRAFYERLLKAGKCKMVALGAAMRKLVHIIYGVLKSNKPFDISLEKI